MAPHPKPTAKAATRRGFASKPKKARAAKATKAPEAATAAEAVPPKPKATSKPKAPPTVKEQKARDAAMAERRASRAETKPAAPEGSTKTDMLLGMLKRDGGATSKEMEEATGWAPHSVRGLLGTLRKKGVAVTSTKLKGEATIYRIAASVIGDVV